MMKFKSQKGLFGLAISLLASGINCHEAQAEPHQLLHNFTAPLPQTPTITTSVDLEHPKFGLGSAQLDYRIDPLQRRTSLRLADEAFAFTCPGTLKVWIKGDASGNQVQFVVRHGNRA